MSKIINRIKQHPLFFTGYLIVLIAGCLFLFLNGKAGSFLILNTYHYQWADNLFIAYTNLGDGIFAVLLSLCCFFVLKKKKLGLVLLVAYLFTGILAQVIKPIVESPRPLTYFSPQRMAFFIDGVTHHGYSSFPSGHTVTAFAIITILAFYTSKSYQLLLLALAVLVGFSRIYLSQHFLTDVLAGSFVGVLGALLCVHWFRHLREEKLVFKKQQRQKHTTE